MILFASFILLCGLMHLISIVTLWHPVYAVHGAAMLATATVSLLTAAVLFPLVPVIAALPTPSALKASNASLAEEVRAHRQTLEELCAIRDELEERVAARTAELEKANERLTVPSREAVHRRKNPISIIRSFSRGTARTATDARDMHERLAGRLGALAASSEIALPEGGGQVDLRSIAEFQPAALLTTFGARIALDGPEVELPQETAQYLALALHELATSTMKYGALAVPEGRVSLSWARDGAGGLELLWAEQGISAPAGAGERESFGTLLLTEAVPMQLGGTAERTIGPEGLRYRLTLPAGALA